MENGEYKIVKIRDNLKVKQLMGIVDDNFIYVLFKNNCIELRTKEQHELLLNILDEKIRIGIDADEVEKYKKYKTYVIGYSRTFELYKNRSIYFGVDIINRYNLRNGAIVEKCSDCIRLWNSSLFKIKQDEDCHKKHRR